MGSPVPITLPLGFELRLPTNLALALIEGGTCPACLGYLDMSDVCSNCHLDVSPIVESSEVSP